MDVFNAMIGFVPTTNTSGTHKSHKVGLAVGLTISLCAIAIAATIALTVYRRRKQRQALSETTLTQEASDEGAVRSSTMTDFPSVIPFSLTAPTTPDLISKEARDSHSLALPSRMSSFFEPAAYVEGGAGVQFPRAMSLTNYENSSQSNVQLDGNGNVSDPTVVVELMQRLNEALAATLPPRVVESPPVYEQ